MDISAQFLSIPPTGEEADGVCLVQGALVLKGHSTERRHPVHLLFLVDVSDSMSEDRKLETVKQSLEFVVPLLTSEDRVSLISFGNQAEILLKQVPASEQIPILSKIRSLRTAGYTNLSGALMCITDCMESAPADLKTGVLLLTDGHANQGVSDLPGLKTIVRRLVELHPSLTLTSIGYGHDHQVDLLRDTAEVGGGSYNVVYTLESVATTFGEVLGGLTTVVAQNIEIHAPSTLEFQSGYAVRTVGHSKCLRVGDIYADTELIVLFRGEEGAQIRITGHNMLTLSSIATTLVPTIPSSSDEIPKSIQIARFRQDVSSLLRDSTRGRIDPSALIPRAEELRTQLRSVAYASDQIIQMMIDDLEHLLQTLEFNGNHIPDRITTNLAQHGAYLAMGRGLRSQMPEDEYETTSPPPAPRAGPSLSRTRTANVDSTSSPFSNPTQRRVTQTLRTMSSQV